MATERQQVMESINPATGELLATFPLFTDGQIDRALDRAQHAFRLWRDTPLDERSQSLRRVAGYLQSHRTSLASLITSEMGKPIVQAEAEIDKCAWNCQFFADHAARFLADQPHPSLSTGSYVAFDPLGVVLAIMPWNFPFWQVLRFAAPALVAGNTAVLKHSSNVPKCAQAIEEVFRGSGLPEGVFGTLLVSGSTATRLIADSRIAAVTLTGSDATGAQVATAAGNVVKKTVLELGGSDPFLVLEDADLDSAAQYGARARYQNGGQSCVAAKRFIVLDSVADAFLQRFAANVAKLKVGNPAERTTDVGPLARDDLRDALDRQVRESVAQGARLVLGGHPMIDRGYFYAPTILADVTASMPAFNEETFGPVAAITQVRSVDEGIEMANATKYGLGANLWTKDIEQAKRLARRIEAGSVFINGTVASDPRLPFGGVKRSGYGRELSEFGIQEFTNIKTIWIGDHWEARPQQQPSE